MSELPKGWKRATIEELIDPQRKMSYGVLKPGPHVDAGVRLLKSNQVNHGTLDLTNDYRISQTLSDEYKRTILQGGELLLNVVGSIGRTAIAPPDVAGANVSRAIAVLPIPHDFVRWIHHYFSSPQAQSEMFDRKTGIAQPVLNLGQVKQMEVPLPPLPEQRRIVARIEELFSRLDAGVAALRQAKAQLQRYRQSVLAAAVTGQLTQAWREQHPDTEPAEELLKHILEQRCEQWNGRGKYKEPGDFNHAPIFKIPESWKWTSLDQLMLNITDGDHQAPPQTDVGIPFLVIGNIRSGSISFDDSRFVREDYFQSLDCFRTPLSGDILYSLVGSFGIAVLVKTEEPFCVQRHIGILRPHSASPTAFLSHALNSRFVYEQASEVSTGTAQKTVPLSGLRKIAIPLPPLVEQHQIVAEVETRTTAIDHLEAELDRQNTRASRLRQAILASAFSGEGAFV